MPAPDLPLFATAPRGAEDLLAAELRTMGIEQVRVTRAGVAFGGKGDDTLAAAYRACLWSRVAGRVLLRLTTFPAADPQALYEGMRSISWDEHLAPDGTLAVDVTTTGTELGHTHYAAQKAKDAVVDQFRERYGHRPSVDRATPDLRIHIHAHRGQATVSVDLSGESLHRRHYRVAGIPGEAPLKEHLAAAILLRAGWPALAEAGGGLVDPLCGSGTLVIEAAFIAGDVAPGILRPAFGFSRWKQHDGRLWGDLLADARARREAGRGRIPVLVGLDRDAAAIRLARACGVRAGLGGAVRFQVADVSSLAPPPDSRPGLVVTNPPYGVRLGQTDDLEALYATLGDRLRAGFDGWQAAILAGDQALARHLGLRAQRATALYNGPLRCRLLAFDIAPARFAAEGERGNFEAKGALETSPESADVAGLATVDQPTRDRPTPPARLAPPPSPTRTFAAAGADMLANRLRKNLRTIGAWARREGITCYRLYDADLPEFALAIDRYEDWVHVQEYAPPPTVDPKRARIRLEAALVVIPEVLQVPVQQVALKTRRRQRGAAQYQRQDDTGGFLEVREGGLRFLVNLTDYLDTGLFLDHRPTRALLRDRSEGRRFLNLFGYTGTATVYAAAGGAASTTTVDLSRTYLDWSQRNLMLNGFGGPAHGLVRADARLWLRGAPAGAYDLVFLDPPTFSNSAAMTDSLDVQRDHVELIRGAVRLLAPDGTLLFSTNRRRFKLDTEALLDLAVDDITARTVPRDFLRTPRIHHCWVIRRTAD